MNTVGLRLLFVVGMLVGLALAPLIFVWSFLRKARAVHFDGVVCRARLTALDQGVGRRLAGGGAALVRLSGGFEPEGSTKSDVLGLALRTQTAASDDPTTGDQDLIFGTFESFRTVIFGDDRERVKVGDYLANQYASVTPWRVRDLGVVHLRAMPPRDAVADGTDRVTRLDADIAAGTARFTIEARDGAQRTPLIEVALVERLPSDGKALRMSMWRNGRGFHPTGARNGIRAIVYPVSQRARRLRNG